jgi:hypothetical protein
VYSRYPDHNWHLDEGLDFGEVVFVEGSKVSILEWAGAVSNQKKDIMLRLTSQYAQ